MSILHVPIKTLTQKRNMAYTQENIQLSESVVKYNLINFVNF